MSHPILDELLADRPGVSLCWLGNVSWLLAAHGRLIAFDLDLDSQRRLNPSPVPSTDIATRLDVLLITHEHGNHFNSITCGILARRSNCLFVLPANCVDKASAIGIPPERIRIALPRQEFDLEGLHVQPMRAFHGNRHLAVFREANLDDCGYVLTFGGMRFLQPGDSILTQDHLTLSDIDVLFVSPTIHNMHIQPAATLIHALRPRHVFPQHFDTYVQTPENEYWTNGFGDELRSALDAQMQTRYHKLHQGETLII